MSGFPHSLLSLLLGEYRDNPHFFPRISADETYLSSFPRSGNTWLRCLLTSLYHGTEAKPELVKATIPDVYKILYPGSKNRRKPSIRPLVIKTHGPVTEIPAKVVYLVRDGRDAMLSFYYFRRRKQYGKRELTPKEFFFHEKIWPCAWHDHVMGWLDWLETLPPERYLLMRYEELLAEPLEQLCAIAEFVGFPTDTEALERAIALNTRDNLKTIAAKAGRSELYYVGEDRKAWQEVLGDEDLARYEALAGPALKRLGYPLMSDSASSTPVTNE